MNKNLIEKLLMILLDTESKQDLVSTNESEFKHEYTGKHVIVRCRDAGVHFGILKSINGRTVEITNTRRMYRWWAAKQMTLSAVAEFGLNKEKALRIQNELPSIILLDACEVIPCSDDCVKSFSEVEPHDEQ